MMVITFVNIAVVCLIVNMNIGNRSIIPVFQGNFRDFSVEWYRLVGSVLCIQIALMIFTNNLTNLAFMMLSCLKRCCNRGCKCSAKHTTSLCQQDYEDANMGGRPLMEYKYASLILVLYITMMYGSGMPILYLITCVYFFATYWTEKFLFFNEY